MTRDAAKGALLRALEQIEDAESDLGADSDWVHLCVVYSAGRDLGSGGSHEVGGRVSTTGPQWVHAAMLRRAADTLERDAEGDG